MPYTSYPDFMHGATIKRFEMGAIEHLHCRSAHGRAVLEQHKDVAAEPVGPTRIVEHHDNRSSLPCQFVKQ
jgi:hypothetical protein